MKRSQLLLLFLICIQLPVIAQQTPLSLNECFRIARQKNTLINQVNKSVEARRLHLEAEKNSYLPGVDLLAGYHHLSKPLEINLQTVKDGIVEGSSQQNVNTANEVFKEITGNDLPQAAQDRIYSASKTVIGTLYPDYNPALNKQDYFTASLGVRQPLYLGGKLVTAKNIAQNEYDAGTINLEITQKGVDFALAVQYLRMLYINSILKKELAIVDIFRQNRERADELVKNELIPPYLRNWTSVAYTQALTRKNNIELEKKNIQVEINRLMGSPLDSSLTILDTLRFTKAGLLNETTSAFWSGNPSYKFVESKTSLAENSVKASRSLQLPNIFAVGNVNLYQKDLPVTTPPWLIGVEMQWTLFSGFRNTKRVNATKQLVEEARLAQQTTQSGLEAQLAIVSNKLAALENDVSALDSARTQATVTTSMVRERLNNEFATVKDVNDALLIQEEIEKAYYTAVLGYYVALAEYWNLMGTPQRIAEFIK